MMKYLIMMRRSRSDNNATMLEKDDYLQELKQDERIKEIIGVEQFSSHCFCDGEDSSVTIVVPNDVNAFADFTTLRHRGTTETIPLRDDGALITEKAGHEFRIKSRGQHYDQRWRRVEREIKITAIVENYVGHYLYLSPTLFPPGV